MLTSIIGAAVMVILHFDLPVWGFFSVIVVWGLIGGVSASMSRTIVQAAAAPSHRARVLSVFTLATFAAGAPAGSFAMGYMIAELGIFNATLVSPAAMVFVWLGVRLFTPLWHIEEDADAALVAETPAGAT